MPDITVASANQADIISAIQQAGPSGTVRFAPGVIYNVDGLAATVPDQTWIMRGVTLLRVSGSNKPIISLQAGLTVIGGTLDGNGGAVSSTMGIAGVQGVSLKWRYGALTNHPGWGIYVSDADLILDRVSFSRTAYAAVLWQALTLGPTGLREAPKIRRCTIDRSAGYVSSGGVLINGGSGTKPCMRPVVSECEFIMPADQTYDNVAVELNYTQLGRVIGNSLVGSRIGFSMQSGSGCVHIGNTSKSVTNYAHEIQNCEWCVVEGNSSTGTTGSICGAVMSGTATSNKIVNNQFSLYPTPVSDVSTWAAGYPSTISSNG